MQERSTGDMHQISEAEARRLERKLAGLSPQERAAHPVACVFRVGQIVELSGGRFRIACFGKRFLRLEGLPGTRIASNVESR